MALITQLLQSSARNFLYLPNKIPLNQAISVITSNLRAKSSVVNISVLTFASYPSEERTVSYDIRHLTQPLLNLILSDNSQVCILQLSSKLSKLQLPSSVGRILLVGDPFSSVEELAAGLMFINQVPLRQIQLLNIFREYGSIGYTLSNNEYGNFNIDILNPIELAMTPNQEAEYRRRQNQNVLHPHQEATTSLEVTNFIYPSQVQQSQNLAIATRSIPPSDRLKTEGGWIEPTDLNYLAGYSPKINWCIAFLKKKGNQGKHIILTSFDAIAGVRVIITFLRLAKIKAIRITGEDKIADRYQKIKYFNEFNNPQENLVCVTNFPAFIGMTKVRSIINFENHSSDRLINSYLRFTAPFTDIIYLLFLVAVESDGKTLTIDGQYYDESLRKLRARDRILYYLNKHNFYQDLEFYQQALQMPNASFQQMLYSLQEYYFRPL